VVAELETLTGGETRRIHVDKGYRGHNQVQKFRVWITGQVRRVTAPIRREIRRRAALKPVIGDMKADHRPGRNYLKAVDGRQADGRCGSSPAVPLQSRERRESGASETHDLQRKNAF